MSPTLSALWFLRTRSFVNAVVSRFKRLKQPKYLLGAVVGVAYFYFFFFRRQRLPRGVRISPAGDALPATLPVDWLPIVAIVAATLLLIVVLICWLWPRDRASLNFSEAEIAFLFPAPISRASLIQYHLTSSQLRILFTAAIFSLISNRWSFLQGNAAVHFIGWWIIVATVALHVTGSGFTITRLLDRGLHYSLRLPLILALLAAIAVGSYLWTDISLRAPVAADLSRLTDFGSYLSTLTASGPLSWLMQPFKWVVAPLLAPDWRALLYALGPALLVYAAHFLWTLSSAVSFEEATIVKAGKRAAKIAAARTGRFRLGSAKAKARRAPFNVATTRRPELAFLWKNLLSAADYLRPRTALIIAAIIVLGHLWINTKPYGGVVSTVVAIFASVFMVWIAAFGPQMARQDLRSDLMNTDILKAYPLRGWQIVLGELLTPVVILTVLIWLALLAASLSVQSPKLAWLTPQLHIAATVGVGLLAPFLCMLQMLVVNAFAVLFPAWSQNAQGRQQPGLETMGQQMLFVAGQFLAIIVALIPAVIAAGILFFVARWLMGTPVATGIATLAILAVLGVEIGFGVRWLGTRFERLDLSAELRP